MKDLFENLPKLTLQDKVDYLIDTCFFIWIFEHHKEKDFMKFLQTNKCAVTSFNVEELIHVEHRLHDNIKVATRKFFHKVENLFVLEVPVHPGNPGQEHAFVKLILPAIDETEHDPSDAVMVAAAVKVGANVLTRDKHDIFNTRLENFLQDYDIKVLNTFS
jgi:predicted nucleic acid-binding protein